MHFSKWQGCGNDFVLVDCFKENVDDFAAFAKQVCDRHYGIGGDGVLYVLPSDKADFRMRIFNTDGSEAEMCGNGIRCFARYLHDFGLTEKEAFTVETGAGILVPRLQLEAGKVCASTWASRCSRARRSLSRASAWTASSRRISRSRGRTTK